jgi:alpha-tubulin suppressor-like RCC1 family protein
MGIPVVEHVPGDLLAWGAASRVPQAASTRSAADPELWPRSKLPAPLQCNAVLDVRYAAVGRLHGILVTSSGGVYTWGEGKGGKLGLGHDQDQATPHRLEQGLRGQCVVAVACGDDCTAAVTDAGALYMWGRLASSLRPQLVPVPMRGDLNSRVVTKVGQPGSGGAAQLVGRGEQLASPAALAAPSCVK